KSTIVKLLARHYDPKAGAVRVNATDIRDVALESLRGQMAIVQQETHLFSGSIRDNIRYGRPDATDEQVVEAARIANAHEFISDLPRGYDTDVQERGLRLSNGQRQLISFARAVLASPAVLILDEATSSVDPLTEKRIRDALRVLLHDRIAFMIAHRLSTVSESSQILVIDEGRVVDRGRHSELIDRCDLYRTLYHRRFREDDTEQTLLPAPATEGPTRTEP
ncbi:MAG TPA: ATP-binding cassette domain-containing protein, partial [Armatimonadota bacterium]|nr:ATP-binding cassette domain-containing protein [Armatimonadota bacterium]